MARGTYERTDAIRKIQSDKMKKIERTDAENAAIEAKRKASFEMSGSKRGRTGHKLPRPQDHHQIG